MSLQVLSVKRTGFTEVRVDVSQTIYSFKVGQGLHQHFAQQG